MKRLAFFATCIVFSFCSVMAQNSSGMDTMSISQESVGFKSVDFDPQEKAINIYTDAEGKYIALECVDPKTEKKKVPEHVVKVYSMTDKTIKWTTKAFKPGSYILKFVEQGLLEITKNSLSLLNKGDGSEIWTKYCEFIGIVDGKIIVRDGSVVSSMAAYSINDGTKIWSKAIKTDCGLDYYLPLDDNHGMFVADNLFNIT